MNDTRGHPQPNIRSNARNQQQIAVRTLEKEDQSNPRKTVAN
jgi:hypothetical protein